MPKLSNHRAKQYFPDENRTRTLLEAFDLALLEPDEQHRLWGYRWILDIRGVKHPCEAENSIWAHFSVYTLWWYDNALQYDHLTSRYRNGTEVERQTIRDWVERGAQASELPYKAEVSGDLAWRRLEPWDERWLAEVKKKHGHPLFLSARSLEDHLREAIQVIDAERERDALREQLPLGDKSASLGMRI
ncbi:hypothetical protein ACFONN_07130 [Dyella humi]|uniref:Uncharacterized protein n=1 Tax=Dyella humi TaxID=1770547 RepID=A0ABW8IJT3_9GAMM